MTLPGIARGGLFAVALVVLPFVFGQHWVLNLLIFTVMYAALATSWNLFSGYTGYVSLGNVAFFGIGAYALALSTEHVGIGGGYRPFALLPLVGIGVGIAAVPIGFIALRTRAITFAIVTLTLLFIVQNLAFNLRGITHGSQGVSFPPPPFPLSHYEWPFYYGMVGVLLLALLAAFAVRRTKLGLVLFALRDDEEKARGVGVRVTGAKLVTFALSAGLTAMAGGIWGYYIAYVYPEYAVDPLVQIGSVLMVFLGGVGTLWGPVLGAFILVPAQQYLAYRYGASEYYLVGYAAVFVGIMLLLPRGILPSLTHLIDRARFRSTSARSAAPKEIAS